MWEYKVHKKVGHFLEQEWFDEVRGWELVQMDRIGNIWQMLFRRPINA